MQRSDITRFIEETIKRFKPTFEQITKALEKLHNSNYIDINREKGIISYLEWFEWLWFWVILLNIGVIFLTAKHK